MNNIKKFLKPMSNKIENKTLDENNQSFAISLEIYLLFLQIIYLLQNKIFALKLFFGKESIIEFLLSLIINNTVFFVILAFVKIIRKNIWKHNHKSDCYISGTWYYIFHRDIDKDKRYIRTGFLEISQNYYDLEIMAENYNVFLCDGILTQDKGSYSHWFFSLGEIDKDGNVFGCYSKDNIKNSVDSSTGIMSFYKPPQNCNGEIKKLRGSFKDSGASQVSGNIDLYKADFCDAPLNFLESAPKEWTNEVNRLLQDKVPKQYNSLKEIVKTAAKILPMNAKESNITYKDSERNIVTNYDVFIQEFLIEKITYLYPDAKFLCEENVNTIDIDNKNIFVIDPIDGTTNFSNNSKFSCISVAKLDDGEVTEAVVYNPYLDEMFYAKKGLGAFLNNSILKIEDKPLNRSIVGFTNCPYDPDITESTFEFGKMLFKNSLDLRRMGSSALEICYTACGRYQLYFEMILYPWDYMAAKLIVEEAGGIITDSNNKELKLNKRCSVVAGAPTAHKDAINLFNEFSNTNCYVGPKNIDL